MTAICVVEFGIVALFLTSHGTVYIRLLHFIVYKHYYRTTAAACLTQQNYGYQVYCDRFVGTI